MVTVSVRRKVRRDRTVVLAVPGDVLGPVVEVMAEFRDVADGPEPQDAEWTRYVNTLCGSISDPTFREWADMPPPPSPKFA